MTQFTLHSRQPTATRRIFTPLVCFILVVSKCRLIRFLLKNKQLVVLFKCLFEIIQARCLSFFQVIDKPF